MGPSISMLSSKLFLTTKEKLLDKSLLLNYPAPTIGNTNNIQLDSFLAPGDHIVNSRKDIVVVVDPGHGSGSENVGAVATKGYKHFVKGADNKPELGPDKNPKVVFTSVLELPSYVINDISKSKKEWITERVGDNGITEADLVLKVAQSVYGKLKAIGYTVFLTRNTATGISNQARSNAANLNKAIYFISIHADGDYDYRVTGAHAIYREGDDSDYNKRQHEFAEDIFSLYDKVATIVTPRKDIKPIRVLSPSENKAERKTLLELGFISNPDDYDNINNNVDTIARQIIQGIEINVRKHFFTQGVTIYGYYDHRSNSVVNPQEAERNALFSKPSFYTPIYENEELKAVVIP